MLLDVTLRPALEGDVEPGGWVREAMATDLHSGFTGHLDRLAPDLLVDDEIFGRDRLTAAVRAKDLGALSNDADWTAQFLWWNAETQGNWRDGWLHHALWAGSPTDRASADAWVASILATQDEDGYLGIYAPDLRFPERGENGELWAQTCLLRALLGYYGHTGDPAVLDAVQRAAERTMAGYPQDASNPFGTGSSFGGVSHGLMFTDVCLELALRTGEARYVDDARWLYESFSASPATDRDAAAAELLDPLRGFGGHGVHTYEHWRALMTASMSAPLGHLLDAYAAKLAAALTPSGAPNGDELCHAQGSANATGYELCSVMELLAGYGLAAALTGEAVWGDRMEELLFNAGFGMRDPLDGGVAYLKTDNSRSMTGEEGFRSPVEGAVAQTRYRFSPVHREAAVCCVPNAGRLLPTYARYQWLTSLGGDAGDVPVLTALLLAPSSVRVGVAGGGRVTVAQTSDYPATHRLVFTVDVAADAPVDLVLAIRRPGWATGVSVSGVGDRLVSEQDGYLRIVGPWPIGHTSLTVDLAAAPEVRAARGGETLIGWGPLLFARPLPGRREVVRTYPVAVPGASVPFRDIAVHPVGATSDIVLAVDADPQPCSVADGSEAAAAPHAWQRQGVTVTAVGADGTRGRVSLVPMGATVLRQLTFTRDPST